MTKINFHTIAQKNSCWNAATSIAQYVLMTSQDEIRDNLKENWSRRTASFDEPANWKSAKVHVFGYSCQWEMGSFIGNKIVRSYISLKIPWILNGFSRRLQKSRHLFCNFMFLVLYQFVSIKKECLVIATSVIF